jgi:long-chain acyl-CoA synthetase
MLRTLLYADPAGRYVHDVVLESCRLFAEKTAIVDSSCDRRFTYAEYGELVESLAHGMIAAGLQPGEVVAIFLPNSWEFCATYHAITLAGGIPTLMNPTYREREVRYQLDSSGAVFLITDAPFITGIDLSRLSYLRRAYTTRTMHPGTEAFSVLLHAGARHTLPSSDSPTQVLAALPYSSGTTGLPKGVMLSHYNLLANVFQLLGPHAAEIRQQDTLLCFLPLYHIYGLNVGLNPILTVGGTLVLMPRFHIPQLFKLMVEERVTIMLVVPPAMNALTQAAEAGQFPPDHSVCWVKSGAAPLAPELPRRFTTLTNIRVTQGYGMTEASPVTHIGFLDPELYKPESIGQPVALTECRVLDDNDREVAPGDRGELVMRGPQFMVGYWKEPQATTAVLRDGWYRSGDVVTRDEHDLYYVLDRRKEMIKYKGFPVAPAEVEAVLLEHPAVRDCGVVARPDPMAGEIPCAFVVLRDGNTPSASLEEALRTFVAERLTHYKQPREIRFVEGVPRTASGKILRRELRNILT